MGMGSYRLGSVAKITLQVTEGGIAEISNINPTIKFVVKPDKTLAAGFPANMLVLNQSYGAYYYEYTPNQIGDYVIIMTYTVDSTEYTTSESFTVISNSTAVPRAESR